MSAKAVCWQLIKDEKTDWGGTLEIEGKRGVKSHIIYPEGDPDGSLMLKPV
jgi:hypothetical protein